MTWRGQSCCAARCPRVPRSRNWSLARRCNATRDPTPKSAAGSAPRMALHREQSKEINHECFAETTTRERRVRADGESESCLVKPGREAHALRRRLDIHKMWTWRSG